MPIRRGTAAHGQHFGKVTGVGRVSCLEPLPMNFRPRVLVTVTACLLVSGCSTTTIFKSSFQAPPGLRSDPEVGTLSFIPRIGASGETEPPVQEVVRSLELGSPALRISTPPDWTVSFNAIPVEGRTNASVTVAWRGRWEGPLPPGGTLFNLMAEGIVAASVQITADGIFLFHDGAEHRVGAFTAGKNHNGILTYRTLDGSASLWFQEERARPVTGSSFATWQRSPNPARFQFIAGTVGPDRNGSSYWFDDVLMTHQFGYQGRPPAPGGATPAPSPPPPSP